MGKEYVEKATVLAEIADIQAETFDGGVYYGACRVEQRIMAIPVADVQPVVLCKDCKHSRRTDEYELWCDGFCSPARLVRPDDFCSHGKRRRET